jgi:DnaJ family protein C protein 2
VRNRTPDFFGNAGHSSNDIGVLSYQKKDGNGDYDEIKIAVYIDQSDDSELVVTRTDVVISTRHCPSIASLTEEQSKMTAYEDLPMAGFPMPEGWKGDSPENPNFKALGKLSPPIMRKIEPSGPAFLAYARRKLKGRTFSEDDRIEALSKVKKIEDNDDGEISEPEDPMMLQRDAKDWKVRFTNISCHERALTPPQGQDHYAVLGLSKYRYKATDSQIKSAHRKKVLRHHPDKKAAQGQSENDQFFKCIQRAHEILSDPVKRRQFDSVDEEADVEPPTRKQITKPKDFYKKWTPVFQSEARFSNLQPVPSLGDESSSKEDVEGFYDFWYSFNSWRTFEYLDEDVPDDNEGRDHKRHVEKKNANARRKHKNEDIARLRKLVDDCLGMDERIKKFRQEGAKNKNRKRDEKAAALKAETEAKKKVEQEAVLKAKADEEAAKADREAGKKAKEAAKTAVKKNRRTIKTSVKDVNYFAAGDASAKQIDDVLDDVESITKAMDPDQLAELVSKLNVAGKDGEKVKGVFTEAAGGKEMRVFR